MDVLDGTGTVIGEANAKYDPDTGTITISRQTENPVQSVFVHEIVHRIKNAAPEAYAQMAKYVVDTMDDARYEGAISDRSWLYGTTDTVYLQEEIVADAFGRVLGNSDALDAFVRSNRNFAQRILDAIRDLIDRIRGRTGDGSLSLPQPQEVIDFADKAEQMAKLLESALNRAATERMLMTTEKSVAAILQGGADGDTIVTTRNSWKEDLKNGGERKEEREDFLRRADQEGDSVFEGKIAAYGYRNVPGRSAKGIARQVQEELKVLGIDADIIDGTVLWNKDGVTRIKEIQQAVTVERSRILIHNFSTVSPRNIAGHEAFHLWKNGTGRDAYIATLEDNLLFSSEAFLKYQSAIADAYLGVEADLNNNAQMGKLLEEVFAYISGDIHEGVYDKSKRPMFRDFDAVKAAWNELVEENKTRSKTGGDVNGRLSLKSTDSPDEADGGAAGADARTTYDHALGGIRQGSAPRAENPGLVRDQAYRRNRYDARTERTLDTIAKTAGVAVTVADRVDVLDDTGAVVGEANAKYDPDTGTITISRQTEDPVRAVFLHEMVHRIRSAAPEAYAQMAKFVVDNMSGANYEKAMAGRATQYGTTESAYLQEELVADAFGRILYDTDAVASFVRQHRNAAQRLLDAIRDFLDRLRGRSGDGSLTLPKVDEMSDFTGKAEQMARLLEDALNRLDGQKNTARQGGETRYLINRMFSAEIRTWAQEGRADGKRFTLGSTGPVLQGLGAIESDLYMNSDKINTILKVHPEMTIREIQKIPEILEDPVLVLKSRNVGGARSQYGNSRMTIFGSVKAQDGRPVMCVMDLRPTENGFLMADMQKVNSAYTKDTNPTRFVSASEVLYADQKRTIPLLRGMGFQMPMSLLQSGSIGSISYSDTNVNLSGAPFSSVVQIGETSSNGMGEGADQRNRADRDSVKTPLVDPAQAESRTDTPEPTGLSLPAPPKARTDSTHWMDKDKRAVYHETEETPLLPLRWNGEAPVRAENGAATHDSGSLKSERIAAEIQDNPREINIHGEINSELDEVDLVHGIIYEDKSAAKLYMENPDFPQTEVEWAHKQIYKKGSNRINAIQQPDFILSGSSNLPETDLLKSIKNYVFRIDTDTPELRAAVQKELNHLKRKFPNYKFSAMFGGEW